MSSRAQRLRTAAEAPRLADYVRVCRETSRVCFRDDDHPLLLVRQILGSRVWEWRRPQGVFSYALPTREAAIRAGLLALAEREEAKS